MANLDMPRGFMCKGVPLRVNKYEAGSTVYPGSLVTMASDGQCDEVTAGVVILGLAMSYATVGLPLLVADDPNQLIIGQCDETEIDAQTDIGNCCDIVATAGNSTYKASRQEVDSSNQGTGTAQLMILGIVDSPNNVLGEFVDVICKINEHQLANTVAGV